MVTQAISKRKKIFDRQPISESYKKWGKVLARAFLRGNSVLCGVTGFGRMSRFDVKPQSLPISTIICNLFPKFDQ